MHEQSLVKTLLRHVDEIRREHDADHATEVRVEVGPLSGVEPLLLATAFEQLTPHSATTLVIDEVALLARCNSCVQEFEVQNIVFRCPSCGGNVKVIQGDELHLVSVSLTNSESTQEQKS